MLGLLVVGRHEHDTFAHPGNPGWWSRLWGVFFGKRG